MNEENPKIRLDTFLAQKYPEYSRSLIQKLIKDGRVKVDGYCLKKPSIDLYQDKDYEIKLDLVNLNKPKETIDVEIIYEDNDVVVANKPIGTLTHSKGAYNPETSLADWLKLRPNYEFSDDNDRGGIVHRLDRATSGVVICAKNQKSYSFLQKQFAERTCQKSYAAIIEGSLKNPEAMIDLPIIRNPKKPQTFRVGANGKPSQTKYKTITQNHIYSLLELNPITGRTHQLRVHLRYLDHPIIGDTFYDGKKADRLYLHAHTLQVKLPSGVQKKFIAALPKEFELKMQ